ncbi:MAG: HAD family phosphatase [Chloroflexota bacterium]
MKLNIQAVIFDMDGLMIDTERIAQQAWQQVGAEWGYTFSDDVYLQAIGRTKEDTGVLFKEAYGVSFPFEEMYAQKQALLHDAVHYGEIPIKDGLLDLLDWLEAQHIPKAVATSTARPTATIKLQKTGLIDRFPVTVCGDEIANGKPAPDIYLKAAIGLGIEPATCLVLEDSEPGTHSAHAAGMIPITVPDMKLPSAETRSIAYAVVDSLHDVLDILKAN